MNIARLRTTAFVVTLALLAQTAMAAAPAPCAGSPHGAASVQAPVMAHADNPHAAHHQVASARDHTGHGTDQRPDCCKGMGPAGCATGGCVISGAMLVPPATTPSALRTVVTVRHPGDWLPPYGSPPSGIFRPPIA